MQAGTVVTMSLGQSTPVALREPTVEKVFEGVGGGSVNGGSLEVEHFANEMDILGSVSSSAQPHPIRSLVGSQT